MIKKGLAALFLLCSLIVNAQEKIKVSGVIIDENDKKPIVGLSIILPNSGLSYTTDEKGTFSLYCHQSDDIFFFMPGYKTARISFKDSLVQGEFQVSLSINRLMGTISKPVIIRPNKTLAQIEEERKKLGEIPRELQKVEVAWTSPISALYELLSDRAKEKAKLREQMVEDQRRRIYKELFGYYNEAKLMDLPEEYYEEFIDYLGLPVAFLKDNTDYEITRVVLAQYRKFGYEKGFIK